MKDFRNLEVWEKAHGLALAAYDATSNFPKDELYGLTSQIRRAAVSIPTNIAEGCGRGTDADFARFLQIAMGSASELEYELLLARDLSFLDAAVQGKLEKQVQSVKQMLAALLRTLHHPTNSVREDSEHYSPSEADSGMRTADRDLDRDL